MFKKLKDKKGFTLVELIVVLVILAILAALLIPALTGYIDKANQDKVAAECRQVVVAAQTEISEAYGKGTLKYTAAAGNTPAKVDGVKADDIMQLAEAKSNWHATITYLAAEDSTNKNVAVGTVVKVDFTDGTNGCVYEWNAASNSFVYTAKSGQTTPATNSVAGSTSVVIASN